jgi:hypothetical protein
MVNRGFIKGHRDAKPDREDIPMTPRMSSENSLA